MKILCRYDKMIPIGDVQPHPDNENKHSEKQIEVLAKIIEKDGVRHPIMISNLSGRICTGHGRLLAFQKLEMTEVPVEFQDFDDPIQELRVRNADNNIAKYSEVDRDKLEFNLKELDLTFEDIDFEEFGEIIPELKTSSDVDTSDLNKEIDMDDLTNGLNKQCPKCGFEFEG